MNFKEMRMRASVVLDKMLEQLEQKSDDYTPAEAGVLEKAVKIITALEDAENNSGKDGGLSKVATEDLEGDFL